MEPGAQYSEVHRLGAANYQAKLIFPSDATALLGVKIDDHVQAILKVVD